MKKEITFFYTDHIEKITWMNLKKKAKQRGFKTKFSTDLSEKVEIGFYNHDRNIKNNAKLSVVSLHGMDQCRNFWPNPWSKMRWDYYDIGLLPGNHWSKMWSHSSFDPYANPKKGVYKVGWPKSDDINSKKFKILKNKIKKKLNPKKKTILYAPTFETDNKQIDILKMAIKLNVNLIVKHWVSKDDKIYSDIYKNIAKVNSATKKSCKDAIILPPKSSIFVPMAVADLLITDESSVLYEAMFFNVPTVIPNDWKMRINNTNKPRNIIPSKFAYKNCPKNQLYKTLKSIFKNLNKIKINISSKKHFHFSNIGKSSDQIILIIERLIKNKEIKKFKIKNLNKIKTYYIFQRKLINIFNLVILFLKKSLVIVKKI